METHNFVEQLEIVDPKVVGSTQLGIPPTPFLCTIKRTFYLQLTGESKTVQKMQQMKFDLWMIQK